MNPLHFFFLSFIFFIASSVTLAYVLPADSEPQQVHISLVGKDGMRISWVTNDHSVKSTVQYGPARGKYVSTARGKSTKYSYFSYRSGKIHHVKIGPLKPGATYYYRCGGHGPEFSFRMPPADFPVEFAIVGDLGQTEWTNMTLSRLGARDYDVFLLPGDLSYADETKSHNNHVLWDSFGRLVEPYASSRPWMVTEGNHEIETFPPFYTEGFRAYNARWLMPYTESSSTSNLYYSFDVAGAHIIMLGSYADFNSTSDQYKWLQHDLARVDRCKTPWIFASLHAPWYNTNAAHKSEPEGENMRTSLEELLYKARVDVVFAGHVHSYERFTRVYGNTTNACGSVHITIGGGGFSPALEFDDPSPSISLFRDLTFGHGRLRVINGTHAHWSWLRNNETSGVVTDELWLKSLSSSKTCGSVIKCVKS